jgi:hypothetical protein
MVRLAGTLASAEEREPMSSEIPPTPPSGGYAAPGPMPDNYLVWAILTTIFCCLPLGIVSIVFASQVSSKYAVGDYAGALDASENAKKWAIWSAVSYVVLGVASLLFFVVVLAIGSS